MPISIQGRTFPKFAQAVSWVRKNMKGITNPEAFVASREQKQLKTRSEFHKKNPG